MCCKNFMIGSQRYKILYFHFEFYQSKHYMAGKMTDRLMMLLTAIGHFSLIKVTSENNQKSYLCELLLIVFFFAIKNTGSLQQMPLSPSTFSPATFVAGVSSLNDKIDPTWHKLAQKSQKKILRTFPRRHVAGDSFALTKNVLTKISFVKHGGKSSRSCFPSDMSLGILLI